MLLPFVLLPVPPPLLVPLPLLPAPLDCGRLPPWDPLALSRSEPLPADERGAVPIDPPCDEPEPEPEAPLAPLEVPEPLVPELPPWPDIESPVRVDEPPEPVIPPEPPPDPLPELPLVALLPDPPAAPVPPPVCPVAGTHNKALDAHNATTK